MIVDGYAAFIRCSVSQMQNIKCIRIHGPFFVFFFQILNCFSSKETVATLNCSPSIDFALTNY